MVTAGNTQGQIRKIKVMNNTGGHDGSASGGDFGWTTTLFGIFPDGAVIVGPENPDALHTWEPTGLHYHKDEWTKSYRIEESLLRPGDFIASKDSYDGQQSVSGGEIKILAHRLPIGEIPKDWNRINGYSSWEFHGYYNSKGSFFRRMSNGNKISLEEVIKELGLQEMVHPFGKLWVSPDGEAVAINAMPIYGFDRCSDSTENSVIGDASYFHKHGFAIVEYENEDGRYTYSCSYQIIQKDRDLSNLRSSGYYPVQVTKDMVVWATGLLLYPKNLEWNLGLHPSNGTSGSIMVPDSEEGKGTRIFDSSPQRLKRLREFFKSIGLNYAKDPLEEYKKLADHKDPRKGKWHNSHQYPDPWKPEFPGWNIEQFGDTIECRWKQPIKGAARFYGIIRRK